MVGAEKSPLLLFALPTTLSPYSGFPMCRIFKASIVQAFHHAKVLISASQKILSILNFRYVVKNAFLMVDFRSRLTDFEFPASNLTKRLEKHENRHFAFFKTKFSLFIMNNDTENVNFGNIPSQTQIRILPQMSFKTNKKYKNNVNIN